VSESTVQLGVRTGPHADLQNGGWMQQQPQDPDPQASSRFSQALADPSSTPSSGEGVPMIGGPFDLLGGVQKAKPQSEGGHDVGAQAALLASVQDVMKQLLIGEGRDGRREARMTLDESLMPGVTVALYEDAGAWVTDVMCSHVDSYQTLARAVFDLARQMSLALSRDAHWRITLDAEDANDAVTVEAYASCT
jgi:hypothetical protein